MTDSRVADDDIDFNVTNSRVVDDEFDIDFTVTDSRIDDSDVDFNITDSKFITNKNAKAAAKKLVKNTTILDRKKHFNC